MCPALVPRRSIRAPWPALTKEQSRRSSASVKSCVIGTLSALASASRVFPFRKHLFSSVDKPWSQRQPSAKFPECFMCGIVGLFLKNPKLRPELGGYLGTMLTTLSDRGPDSAGFAVYGEVRPDRVKLT